MKAFVTLRRLPVRAMKSGLSTDTPLIRSIGEDDNSPHIPLLADSLPKGVQFDGKTFSGVPDDEQGRQGVIVYNGNSAVLVVFICIFIHDSTHE